MCGFARFSFLSHLCLLCNTLLCPLAPERMLLHIVFALQFPLYRRGRLGFSHETKKLVSFPESGMVMSFGVLLVWCASHVHLPCSGLVLSGV